MAHPTEFRLDDGWTRRARTVCVLFQVRLKPEVLQKALHRKLGSGARFEVMVNKQTGNTLFVLFSPTITDHSTPDLWQSLEDKIVEIANEVEEKVLHALEVQSALSWLREEE